MVTSRSITLPRRAAEIDARGEAEYRRDDERDDAQERGIAEAGKHFGKDRSIEPDRRAEIAHQGARAPRQVLQRKRLIQPQLVADLCQRFFAFAADRASLRPGRPAPGASS